MNIVFVKHYTSKEYAFRVPDELVKYIEKGQTVFCETTKGPTFGITTTGVISGDGALDIAIQKGAYLPLKPIVSFMPESFREIVINECRNQINGMFKELLNELPF